MAHQKFSVQDLLQLQSLVYPLVVMLGGPDIPQEFIKPLSGPLKDTATVLRECADVFEAAGTALEDGLLNADEIDRVLAEAEEAQDAIKLLLGGEPQGDKA